MEPLKQFICDNCGELIEKPEDGYVIWNRNDDDKLHEIHIVHKNKRDENGRVHGCDNHTRYALSDSLTSFLGTHGLIELLSLIDPGKNFISNYQERILDMREFIEFFRRVQLPYYEEARRYWNNAKEDGYLYGANEIIVYKEEFLKELIEKYKY